MVKASLLAAFVAGTVAAPSKDDLRAGKRGFPARPWGGFSGPFGPPSSVETDASRPFGPHSSFETDASRPFGPPSGPPSSFETSAAESSSSSINTVYETLAVTVTLCTTTVSSTPIYFTTTLQEEVPSTPAASSSTTASSSSSTPSTSTSSTATSSSSTSSSFIHLDSSVVSEAYAAWTTGAPDSTPSSASGKFAVAWTAAVLTDSNIPPPSMIVPPAPECTFLPEEPINNKEQVGDSLLGTLCADYLPQWLDGSDLPPWGANRTVVNSDATVKSDIPVTNVTRYYEFTISRGQISPDGVLRDVILVNDQFPGPLIQANWGDMIQVIVHNNLSDPHEGTSLHWHGQVQRNTPWEDGVPSIGQCPIAPGHSFTYLFQAELQGTTWYHSHYSSQFSAGAMGPMVVYGPSSLPYDIDVGPVLLSDWYHVPYFSIVEAAVGNDYSLIPPTSDSLLINGRGQFDCSLPSYDQGAKALSSSVDSNITWTCVGGTPLAAFRFQSGMTHRLRLINTGANGVQKFSIDHHNLTVIATDLVPVVPYTTNMVSLGVGQRTDILVEAVKDPYASIWMRTSAPGGEPCGGSSQNQTVAAIYYERADTTVAPTSISPVSDETCVNDPLNLTIPAFSITPSANHWTQDLRLTLELNETGHFEFMINGESYKADYNTPLLPQIAALNFTFDPQWQVYYFYDNTSVILNITNDTPLTHPFHMHGHNFYILNVGDNSTAGSNEYDYAHGLEKRQGGPQFLPGATWDGSIVNSKNPMRRDTVLIPPYGFAAIQFELDNPGVWPFHCHVAWHLSDGQGMSIAYNATGIVPLPENFAEATCADWDYYSTYDGPVDQIDSGA